MQQNFNLAGMHCTACALRIEKVLAQNPHIHSATVNFASEQAQVCFDSHAISPQEIIALIDKIGFAASLPEAAPVKSAPPYRLLALIGCALPFLVEMLWMWQGTHLLPPWLALVLASLVQWWLALPFYQGALASIKAGVANMDVLVSGGTWVIYLYSLVVFLWGDIGSGAHVYFESNVMIVAMVSIGKFLEQKSKRQSLNSLALLAELTPQMVQMWDASRQQFVPTPQSQIRPQDQIRANTGERIGADGVVVSGSASAVHSHLTGESAALAYNVGSTVLAGALLTAGSIVYRAEKVGSQSQLGDMFAALKNAQASKAPSARMADKIAGVFVPAVVVLALMTLALNWLWMDFQTGILNAVAVLVIACPCALGLATPAAIMAGMGRAFKHGIVFKDAGALEQSAHCDVVVFDKTGTLTCGTPALQAVFIAPTASLSKEQLLALGAAIEAHSNHPLAAALKDYFQPNLFKINNIQNQTNGISAEVEHIGSVSIGTPEHCDWAQIPSQWQHATVVGVHIQQQCQALLAFADDMRADSPQAVKNLQQANIEVVILSGDNQGAVNAVASALNIPSAFAKMTPRAKAAWIQNQQQQGKKVAMVGDGVNDAPALATADLSFALQSGSAIAAHSASATLLNNSASQVWVALKIARATVANIQQNLFFALIYNLLAIPLAALGLLNPSIAATAMALSSLCVMVNAMRLGRQKF